jgi:NAD(P)-dependent dehydrogenase (short-subunit alcohol dehydrogenase family)
MLTQMGIDITKHNQVLNPALAEKDTIELRRENVRELNMFGRELTPEDVGKMAAFLASEDARNITGQAINVDGGRCLT